MKVLIIDSDANRVDNTIRIVKRRFKSVKIVHINNYNDAIKTCSTTRDIDEFDLIILDMAFCRARPYKGVEPILHPQTGSMFLAHLAKRISCTPVIIYSSEKDYLKTYKQFLFPAFETICYNYDSYPLVVEGSEVGKLYDEITAEGEELLRASNFVIGHAHNHAEFETILCNRRIIMKKAG